jgi:hypothetical protein
MAALGLVTSINSLPATKVDALLYIDAEFDRLQEEKLKRDSRTKKRGR